MVEKLEGYTVVDESTSYQGDRLWFFEDNVGIVESIGFVIFLGNNFDKSRVVRKKRISVCSRVNNGKI